MILGRKKIPTDFGRDNFFVRADLFGQINFFGIEGEIFAVKADFDVIAFLNRTRNDFFTQFRFDGVS